MLAFWAGGACSFGIAPIPTDDFQPLGNKRTEYDDDDIEKLRRQYAENVRQLSQLESRINEQKMFVNTAVINDNIVGVDSFDAAKDARYLAAVIQAQEEIKRLEKIKAALMRLRDEEEAIMVIILSQPFYH